LEKRKSMEEREQKFLRGGSFNRRRKRMYKEAFKDLAIELTMDALLEAREKGWTYEMLAQKIGGSPHSYRHYYYGEAVPAVAVLFGVIVVTKAKKPVRKLAELVGLVAVDPPEPSEVVHYGRILKETGEAVAVLSKAIEDGKIDKEEASAVVREAKEMLSVWLTKLHELEKLLRVER